jgi:hypothetical protein
MAKQWNLKRLTRADVLVVAGIFLFLIVLIPILLTKPREQSAHRLCGANLAQVGKAMLLYAADHEGALPRAGGPTTVWGPTRNWVAPNRNAAFGLDADGQGGRATISASLYLLVKYYDVPTRSLVCPGDQGTTEFDLQKLVGVTPNFTLARAWDFGPMGEAFKHCSYAYHMPYGPHPLTTSRDPNFAVAADRNPYLKSPMAGPAIIAAFKPDLDMFKGTPEQACAGNAIAHGRRGQNVLFLDGRVTFEKRSYCGLDSDNIYLVATFPNRGTPIGAIAVPPAVVPGNERDSVLVHDPDTWSYPGQPKAP